MHSDAKIRNDRNVRPLNLLNPFLFFMRSPKIKTHSIRCNLQLFSLFVKYSSTNLRTCECNFIGKHNGFLSRVVAQCVTGLVDSFIYMVFIILHEIAIVVPSPVVSLTILSIVCGKSKEQGKDDCT